MLIPVLTIIYGLGDYFNWWDDLKGRTAAIQGWDRLIHGSGYPNSWIYHDEPEFRALEKIINPRTKNPKLQAIIKEGIHPSLITIDGGRTQKANIPEEWPFSTFTPDTALILYVYGITREGGEGKLTWGCSAGELMRWIDEHRNKERFYFSTILISILAIWIAIFSTKREKKRPYLTQVWSMPQIHSVYEGYLD